MLVFAAGAAASQDAAYDWSGAYVGMQAGYGWGEGRYISPVDGQSASPRPDGMLAGVFGGYSHQWHNGVVLGAEADINANDGHGIKVFGPLDDFDARFQLKWSGSARLRLGYALGRFMPFVSAGAAVGKISHDYAPTWISPRTPRRIFEGTEFGWTVGAGVEYRMNDKISTRVEYRYTDYGSKSYPAVGPAQPHSMTLKTNDLRLGIAYKF